MSSELAKKATWSPDEFEPFIPPTVRMEEVKFPEPPPLNTEETFSDEICVMDDSFSAPRTFWEDLTKDPNLSGDFERYIQTRVTTQVGHILGKEREIKLKEAYDEGKKLGYEEGFKQGTESGLTEVRKHFETCRPDFESVIREVISQKTALVNEHEREWANALIHVIQKLQVKEPELFAGGIRKWMHERLMDFPNYTRVRIFVSKQDFDHVTFLMQKEAIENCEILLDLELEKGQVRCDCGEGGVFFSKKDGFARLDQYLEESFK